MSRSINAQQTVVLKVNLENIVVPKEIKSCVQDECRKFQKESSNKFCDSCGGKIIKNKINVDLSIKDLINYVDENLTYFQNFEDSDFSRHNYIDENEIHKDKKYDIYLYDPELTNSYQDFSERMEGLFKEMDESEKQKYKEAFIEKYILLITFLNTYDVKYEIETRIIISQ